MAGQKLPRRRTTTTIFRKLKEALKHRRRVPRNLRIETNWYGVHQVFELRDLQIKKNKHWSNSFRLFPPWWFLVLPFLVLSSLGCERVDIVGSILSGISAPTTEPSSGDIEQSPTPATTIPENWKCPQCETWNPSSDLF